MGQPHRNESSKHLSRHERAQLAELELVVKGGLATFVEVGQALVEIRDRRLYRETHATFEAYCRGRWRMSARHANRTIAAAEVTALVGPTGPSNVAQARELARLAGTQEAVAVWGDLRSEYGEDVTAALVREAVADRLARRRRLRELPAEPPSPPPRRRPSSKRGEVYELGPHRLLCGDATDPEQVQALLLGAQPVLILADPPYGVGLDLSWRDGINGRSTAAAEQLERALADREPDWADAYRLCPSARLAYIWHASRFQALVEQSLRRVGFEVVQQIVWVKDTAVLSRQPYHWQHEPCFFARRPGGRLPWRGGRYQSTVWHAPSPKAAAGKKVEQALPHPTQKPLELYRQPIENHLRPGEAIYDPFAGSGTALIAAELTGRVCFAVEIEPRFCDLIRSRYQALHKQRAGEVA